MFVKVELAKTGGLNAPLIVHRILSKFEVAARLIPDRHGKTCGRR
jgi:hypothetical protein